MNRINWKELSLSDFHQWPELIKYSVFSILCLVFIMIYYFLIFSANLYQYKSLINEERDLKAEFESKQKLANLNAYKGQLISLDKIYKNKLNKLVKTNEISSLLNDISQDALSSGLVFEFFAPKIENNNEFPQIISLSIIVIGEYHNLAQFLNRISAFNKLIVFDDFIIKRKDTDNKKLNSLRMKIRIKIHKYS